MVEPRSEDANHQTPQNDRSRYVTAVLLALILIGSFAFRLVDIHRGLWLDELHTSWTVMAGFGEIDWRAREGNQAPLYFYLTKCFVSIFGHTEFSLRLLSLLSGTGLSLAAYFIARGIFRSPVAGLIAAALMALDPYFVEYSQEARPYAFLQLLGALQIYFFWLRFGETQASSDATIHEHWSTRWVLVFLIAICVYVHFTSVLLTVSLLVSVLVWNAVGGVGWTKKRLGLLVDFLAAAILCLPLAGSILAVSSRKSNWELFVNDSHWTAALGFQFWAYLIPAAIMMACWCWLARKNCKTSVAAPGFILLLAYLVPILLAWVSFKTGIAALYHQRYFMIGWASLILLVSGLLGSLIQSKPLAVKISGWTMALIMFGCVIWFNHLLGHVWKQGRMPFESSWNAAVKHVNQRDGTDDLVLLFPNLIEDRSLNLAENRSSQPARLKQYCLFPISGIYRVELRERLPRPTLIRPRFYPEDKSRFSVGRRVKMIIRGDPGIIADILNEFAEFAVRHDIYLRNTSGKQFPIRGVPQQYISVFEFEVYRGQATTPVALKP